MQQQQQQSLTSTGHPASSWQGPSLGERLIPHFMGGAHHLKSPLLSPYPAIPPYVVRTPHPGITDGREHTTGWIIIGCLPNISFSDPYMSCHASRSCTHGRHGLSKSPWMSNQWKPFSLWKPEMVWARNRQLGKIKETRFSKCVVFLRRYWQFCKHM